MIMQLSELSCWLFNGIFRVSLWASNRLIYGHWMHAYIGPVPAVDKHIRRGGAHLNVSIHMLYRVRGELMRSALLMYPSHAFCLKHGVKLWFFEGLHTATGRCLYFLLSSNLSVQVTKQNMLTDNNSEHTLLGLASIATSAMQSM
jgi:hypothetical protein